MNQLTVSLWGDEAFASILAQKSLIDIVTIVSRDTSPPLHYILLHFWMGLFGNSEIAIRAFPFLLFLLLVYVIYRMARDIFLEKTARIAAILTFLNPFLFVYAFEARMYMLLALTTALSMWFFITKRWLPYVLATAAALYTHHFSVFVVLVQVIYYMATNFNRGRNPLQIMKAPFVRGLATVVLLYLPWLPALYGQITMVEGNFWLAQPNVYDLRDLFYHFVIGTRKVGFETLFLFLAALVLLSRKWSLKKDGVFILWVLLPALVSYFLSQVSQSIFFDRYLIISTVVVPVLLASRVNRTAQLLLFVLMIGLLFINIQTFQNPVKQPFREVARFIHTTYSKDKMVVNYYTNALHYFELKHYDVNVKVYSPSGLLPFWVGTALIDKNDVLSSLPNDRILLVMASGNVQGMKIPSFQEVRRKEFRDLYLFWFMKKQI